MKPSIPLLAIVLATAACTSPSEVATSAPLTITATNGALQLTNGPAQTVFYFIYERQAAALINWAPCVDPSRCASLAPRAATAVPYGTIGGYGPGKTEAIVWWWHAEPGPADGSVPGPIGAVVVRLR